MNFDADLVAAKMLEGAKWVGATYPLDIVRLAPLALPLSIVVEPRLDTDRVSSVMTAMTGREGKRVHRRRLRGCLVAHRGSGMIFLDNDDERNLRFAAAHEVAHFVAHYLIRRDTAVAKLGPKISEVLDGEREPTAAERLAGIFAGSPLGVYTDLMDREDGNPLSKREEIMEIEADTAAYRALAPESAVLRKMRDVGLTVDRNSVIRTLVSEFGLAEQDAARHAAAVVGKVHRPSFLERLTAAANASGVNPADGEQRHD